ncbi:MAG: endonuclease III [Bacteroidota bacterium]
MKKPHKEQPVRKKKRLQSIVKKLDALYPHTRTALNYRDPFQLLVAVILSAQCTDARVNIVTPALFARFSAPIDFANAEISEIESLIHSTGFFRNKAKNIKACSVELLKRHGGKIPNTMQKLHALPGVGRKTANVVLGEAFNITEGIVVDTHVARLSYRLGLTNETDAVRIETDLMALLPKKKWRQFSHTLILHGRQICNARKPLCRECALQALCPSAQVLP